MKKSHLNSILLVTVTISAIFTSLKWPIPICSWIMPIALLAFVRRNTKWRSILFGVCALGIGSGIASYKVLPFPPHIFPVVMLLASCITILPYIIDKWLIKDSRNSFLTTLIFPITAVTVEYLLSLDPNQGNWGSLAITQHGNLPLMQLVSVTGIWGISFLMYWTAAVINWIIEKFQSEDHAQALFGLKIYAGSLLTIFLFGSISLIPSFSPVDKHVRIATITAPAKLMEDIIETAYKVETSKYLLSFNLKEFVPGTAKGREDFRGLKAFFKNPKAPKFDTVRTKLKQYHDTLFAQSQREVDGGAQIVVWSEAAGIVFLEDKDIFITSGQKFARKNSVYLILCITVQRPDSVKGDNLAITIAPDGMILNSYGKSIPVPGESSFAGDGVIPVLETKYGKIAVAICYDADHPTMIQQAGKKGADILLLPSADWGAIVPSHSYMAVFRAIENGLSLVRPVSNGLNLAVDSRGRVLFSTYETATSGWVPVGNTKTIYSCIGDLFAWISMVILCVVIIMRKLIPFLTRLKTG